MLSDRVHQFIRDADWGAPCLTEGLGLFDNPRADFEGTVKANVPGLPT